MIFKRAGLGLAALALAGLCACGSGGPTPVVSAPVRLRNFKIDAPHTLHAGFVRFAITSAGPTMHEFNVARSDLSPKSLPLNADGTVDDLTPHPGWRHLGEAEGIDIGQHDHLDLHLTPGHYVMYCNMEGHYLAGMSGEFEVI